MRSDCGQELINWRLHRLPHCPLLHFRCAMTRKRTPSTPLPDNLTMETISESHDTGKETPPASVVALAAAATAAASRSSARKSTSSNHRRSQTIVAAGDLELEHIQKQRAVEELHSELESKSKELEETQEEVQLAARIGQTLLLRNQEMGAEIESKAIELQNRAESAEQEVKVLEQKLSAAIAQIRTLDIARTRSTLEAEQLSHELENTRDHVRSLKIEVGKANGEVERTNLRSTRVECELETIRRHSKALEQEVTSLKEELKANTERIEVVLSTEKYNADHIARLEIENQSICQQQYVLERREKQLVFEIEALSARHAAQTSALKECQARNSELEKGLLSLHAEAEELRDALHTEQTRVVHLTRVNQELEARLDSEERLRFHTSDSYGDGDVGSDHMLRSGSLFFELAKQLREDLSNAKIEKRHAEVKSKRAESCPEAAGIELMDSPVQLSNRTSRNPSSNDTDSLNDQDDLTGSSLAAKVHVTGAARCRPPPLQLEHRKSQQEEAAEPDFTRNFDFERGDHDADDDDFMLKEFFVLTAAAVKIAGGGLRNDACNIHNEDLYAEAMAEGVTFDHFHRWLERRLEGDLESSLSPHKQRRPEEPHGPSTTGKPALTPPLAPSKVSPRNAILSFWSR